MLFYIVTALINAITSIVLGFFIYLRNKREILNKIFAILCLSVAFWSIFYLAWLIFGTNKSTSLFLGRALNMVAIFIPITYFHFIVVFLNIYNEKKKLIIFGYLLSLILFISGFTSLFVKNVQPELSFAWYPKPGITYHIFVLMFFSYIVYSWYLMFKTIRTSTGVMNIQVKYVLIGTLIGFIGGSTNFLPTYNILVPPFGNGLVAVYVIFITLAILKYHLFDLKVILTEILVGIMGIILLILPSIVPTIPLKVFTVFVFFVFCIFGYYLIKVTRDEVKRREEAERLAKQEVGLREEAQKLVVREAALRTKAEKLAREFKELSENKTQFMLVTSHHLRTPLTAIQGYLSMLSEGSYGRINKLAKEKIDRSFQSTRQLITLINQLLDIAKYEVGREILDKKEIQIEKVVEKVNKDLTDLAKDKGLDFEFSGPKDSLPKVFADPVKIGEAYYNILDNAIKYTLKGKITVKIGLNEKGNLILISVKDTGAGMSKEDMENLGEKSFERGDVGKSLYTAGKGLGVYLSCQIVRAHGGKIWAESEGKDKGTTFHIEFQIKNH